MNLRRQAHKEVQRARFPVTAREDNARYRAVRQGAEGNWPGKDMQRVHFPKPETLDAGIQSHWRQERGMGEPNSRMTQLVRHIESNGSKEELGSSPPYQAAYRMNTDEHGRKVFQLLTYAIYSLRMRFLRKTRDCRNLRMQGKAPRLSSTVPNLIHAKVIQVFQRRTGIR